MEFFDIQEHFETRQGYLCRDYNGYCQEEFFKNKVYQETKKMNWNVIFIFNRK